ncbi:MAG: SpoIIE family protein phosphatase [Anaerolineales bacterium]|nr:SpoIIE family protein phosphatase [Anaerolineales bacterium]
MNTNLLSKIPLFSVLPVNELDHMQAMLQVKTLQPGEILFREGEPGEHFYILTNGELEILLGAETNEELLLNILGPGEYLGEMSLIVPGGERTATARASKESVLLAMSRDEFTSLIEQYPVLAQSMVRVLSNRLDSTNFATFRDLTEKNRQLQNAYDELKAAQEQLIEKERLERELKVAADIQLSILPDVLPKPPRFDFGARIDPARQVGGDFYDVFRVDESKVAVLIGDVADKGVPSAIFMARAHALIAAEAETYENPSDVMRKVNAHITRLEKATQFVTVLYGILNVDTGEFTYARAGHEPPLMLKPDGSVERLPHKTGMAIGLWEKITLDEQTITLPPGSTLVLYTDGMTDCRDPNGVPFGLERIQLTLNNCPGSSAQEICNYLLHTLKNYQQGSPQDDDVTLVAIHAKL